jgi:hypothetical protein
VQEIWEIRVAKRTRQNPQSSLKPKKTRKRKNKEIFQSLKLDSTFLEKGRETLPLQLDN